MRAGRGDWLAQQQEDERTEVLLLATMQSPAGLAALRKHVKGRAEEQALAVALRLEELLAKSTIDTPHLPLAQTLLHAHFASPDYDGSHQLLHARFMTSGAFADFPVATGGFPTARDEWQAVETSINCGEVPSRIEWYLGFPMSHTAGNVWVTDVQITAPDGEQLIPDGSFPGGAHPAAYSAGDSYGTYAVVPSCSFRSPPSPPSGYHLAPTLATGCDYGELVAQSE